MKRDKMTKYTNRFLARIVIEAETPLAIGSGEKDLLTDALVAVDSNGLPYIPATSIAGVVRSMMRALLSDDSPESESAIIKSLFGFQGSGKDKDSGKGSEIIFTEAKLLDSNGCVMDGMRDSRMLAEDSLLGHYAALPVRQHVKITDKGVAADKGLFSHQVVFAGSRFCFEIEMLSDGSNFSLFESVLSRLFDVSFRLGGGTRDGFGKIKIVDMAVVQLDLRNPDDLNAYLGKSSSLNSDFWKSIGAKAKTISSSQTDSNDYIRYQLRLMPESFFQFGSGFSDDSADMTPVKARKVEWHEKDGKVVGNLHDNLVLIPATSLKGALAHRVAFHWNRLMGQFADDMLDTDFKKITGSRNNAVRLLFGSEGDEKEGIAISRGNLIFADIIQAPIPDKMFNHLKIDRFTGGGIEGALFSEKASYGAGQCYVTDILFDVKSVRKACGEAASLDNPDEMVAQLKNAFEAALKDVCTGMLPLGGGVNRGHGVFTGDFLIIEEDEHGKN